jgi:CheY-like chemotaxis protein
MKSPPFILLVEDNFSDVKLTLHAFKSSHFENEMMNVRDGIEALSFLKKEPPYEKVERPDIILLDLNLPRMDGRELISHIKDTQDLKDIPLLVLSTSSHDREQCLALGATGYFVKPLDYDEFSDLAGQIGKFVATLISART